MCPPRVRVASVLEAPQVGPAPAPPPADRPALSSGRHVPGSALPRTARSFDGMFPSPPFPSPRVPTRRSHTEVGCDSHFLCVESLRVVVLLSDWVRRHRPQKGWPDQSCGGGIPPATNCASFDSRQPAKSLRTTIESMARRVQRLGSVRFTQLNQVIPGEPNPM